MIIKNINQVIITCLGLLRDFSKSYFIYHQHYLVNFMIIVMSEIHQ